MEYDPFIKEKMVDAYESLRWPEMMSITPESRLTRDDLDSLLRVVVLLLSKVKIKSLSKRKESCLSDLKVKGVVASEVMDNGPDFSRMLLRYFRVSRNYLFEEWYSRKMAFHNWNEYLRMDLSDEKIVDKQLAINKQMSGMRTELLRVENELFEDEETASIITREQERASIDGYAERFALTYSI